MDIREMLDEVDMEDYLVQEGVDYKNVSGSSGAQLNVKECPFCGGSDWKVYMNAETGLGNCFHGSCPKGTFNKFTFIKELGQFDNAATFHHIKSHLRDKGWRPARKAIFVRRNVNVDLPATVEIEEGSEPYNYLARRGFGREDIDAFGWSFCERGFIPILKQDGTEGRQYFDDRIIIPVTDLNGDLKTFQGRDITGEADRKYLFPSGLAASGKFLYNAQSEKGKPNLVVGEGVFDVAAIVAAMRPDRIMSEQYGAVGTFGKHLSKSVFDGSQDQFGQFVALKELGLKRVIFMWDAEIPALKAAVEAAMQLQGIGLEVSVCKLPNGKDPNEVEATVVRKLIRGAQAMSYAHLARQLALLSFRS